MISFYAALLMKDRVGEEFDGHGRPSLTDFGFFVELDDEHVEGLVRADDLGPGHKLVVGALVWPNGRRVQVGQVLTVRLAAVNVQRRQMDFDVVAFAGERPSRRRGGAERVEVPSRDQERGAPRAQRPGRAEERQVAGTGRPGEPRASGRPGRGNRRNDRTKPDAAAAGRSQANPGQHPGRGAEQRGARPAQSQPSRPVQRGAPEQAPAGAPSSHPGFDRLRTLAQREGRSGKPRNQQGGSAGRGQRTGAGKGRSDGSGRGRRRRR